MKVATIQSDAAPAAIGPYSQATVVAGGAPLLFVSGQLPIDVATGEIMGESLEEQAALALRNALSIVRAGGSSPENVLKVTVFLRDLSSYAAFNKVYADALGESRPARSVVEVSRLPKDALVEIEVVAACRG